MKEKRQKKTKDFEKFYDSCNDIFTHLRDNDNRAEIFQNEYMLAICPGSRAGGEEKRIVEVFWGRRIYEYETKGNQWKSLTETGATLFFYRNDTGDVTISIYPAKTDYKQPIESHISLHEWVDPKKLNDDRFIKSLWNDFMAYMECTCLDGRPTYWQQIRIFYLRNFKHLVIENKYQPTKISELTKEVLKWVLTGGIIFYLLPFIIDPKFSETEIQLKEVNKNLEKIYKLDSISKIKTQHKMSITKESENIQK